MDSKLINERNIGVCSRLQLSQAQSHHAALQEEQAQDRRRQGEEAECEESSSSIGHPARRPRSCHPRTGTCYRCSCRERPRQGQAGHIPSASESEQEGEDGSQFQLQLQLFRGEQLRRRLRRGGRGAGRSSQACRASARNQGEGARGAQSGARAAGAGEAGRPSCPRWGCRRRRRRRRGER